MNQILFGLLGMLSFIQEAHEISTHNPGGEGI